MSKISTDVLFMKNDTKMRNFLVNNQPCLAFEIDPGKFMGFAISDEGLALAVSGYFKDMAKFLKSRKNKKEVKNEKVQRRKK